MTTRHETDPLELQRYPIGRFDGDRARDAREIAAAIASIEDCPRRLRAAVAGLGEEELATPYRPGGWTVRQVVHHLPDSHMNAYTRLKLALTEDEPTIKPYREERWAELESTFRVDTAIAMYAWHGEHHVAQIDALRAREGWQ